MKTKLFLIVIPSLFLFACSTTKEISVKTEETTTIQPIKIEVPPIRGEIPNIPLTKPDTTDNQPYGVYEGEKIITTKDEVTGRLSKAKTKVTVTLKKNTKGKPVADVSLNIQQDSVKTDAKVTKSETTTNTNTTTEPFLITIWNDVKWWILGVFFFFVVTVVLLKKFFPALIKTYLKI